ncbi:beta-lactamase/transpeptidase-like protein [Pluteus cervinus]|uniref:Beta-lactamase/transpeptidase-like protein n=1 Tax=Pluteus cervinus TaxID=181527 RepID=A0ACD3ATF2_9AGAR|nr:beta-lactamase/transpeptidase-like protein [Pluteus cervinus]
MQLVLLIAALSSLVHGTGADELPFVQHPLASGDYVGHDTRILDKSISTFIYGVLSDWNSPGGVAVSVVREKEFGVEAVVGVDGGVEWDIEVEGYGNADANGTPVTGDSLFGIASNSKLFTAIATGLLISNESLTPKITWRTKLASLIPEWRLIDPIAHEESTILDALSHRTGMPRYELAYEHGDSIADVFKRLRNLKPSASFRDIHRYNNMMYSVLSSLSSKLLPSSTLFTRYVKEHIFDRLNLSSTTFSYNKAKATGRLVEGLSREGVNASNPIAPGIPRALPFWAPFEGGEGGNYLSGAAGVISSGRDLAVWLQTLLLDGVHPSTNETIIPASVLDTITTGYSINSPRSAFPELSPSVYGGGQRRLSYRGYEMITHHGYVDGFHTWIFRIPSKMIGIAILTNEDMHGSDLETIIGYRLLDKALGLDPVDWNTRLKEIVLKQAAQRVAKSHFPSEATPLGVPIESLAGIYKNSGYGTIELCPFTAKDQNAISSNCKELVDNVDIILPGVIKPDKPTLIASWNKIWSSHLVLTHFSDNVFNCSAPKSLPTNDTAYPFWVYGLDSSEAESIIVEFSPASEPGRGFGLRGGFWGAGEGADTPSGDMLRERSEVYFDRV